VADGAAGLEDLDWKAALACCVARVCCGDDDDDDGCGNVLHTRMSRTSTMKPTMPPPVPYCVAFELMVLRDSSAIGAA